MARQKEKLLEARRYVGVTTRSILRLDKGAPPVSVGSLIILRKRKKLKVDSVDIIYVAVAKIF